MFRTIAFLALIVVFSCNNTSDNNTQQANLLHAALVDCVTDASLSPEKIAQTKKRIKADEKSAKLDSLFQRKFKLERFNGNVLIAQQGVVLYRNSNGYAQVEKKDTLRADSKFQLASLSKTFTAVAILKLYEAGKLSLDDSIQKFIPQFPYSGIQIKTLLSHRSGLPNYAYVLTDSVRKRNPYPTNDDIVRWYCAVKPKLYNIPNRYWQLLSKKYRDKNLRIFSNKPFLSPWV